MRGGILISKVIHYVWFGGNDLGEKEKCCINSWRQVMPDYEIVCWNESNFDIFSNTYCREAYSMKKWAFVSDYVRLSVLVRYGGIYLDTDVEVLKPFDDLLDSHAFAGFEDDHNISTGVLACEKGFSLFSEFLETYNNRTFFKENGSQDLTTNVACLTKFCEEKGFILNNKKQVLCDLIVYPKDFFCAKDYISGSVKATSNTYAIHHFNSSWLDKNTKSYLHLRWEYLKKHPNASTFRAMIFAKLYLLKEILLRERR